MSELSYVVIARDSLGERPNRPLTGLTPSWVFLSRLADGRPVAPPAITEIGYGQYRFAYDPEVNGEASGQIDFGPSIVDPLGRFVDLAFYLGDSRIVSNLDAAVSSRYPMPSAAFLGADTNTQGNWKGVYGGDGYWIPGGANPSLPAYASARLTGGTTHVWDAAATDARALRNPTGSGRVASCWYTTTTMIFRLNLTGGESRRVSLYAVDYEPAARNAWVEVLDVAGNVLDARLVPSYRGGTYLSWNLKGEVTIRVTDLLENVNAVVSGLFFG